MMRAPDARRPRDLVADTLREKRPDFEAFVRARVRPGEVDDLLQVAALRAIERAHTIDDLERVEAWIYRIHRNLVVDRHRARATEAKHRDDRAVPDGGIAELDDPCACSLSQAQRLQPSYASILTLVDTDGLAVAEAARELRITPNNAAVRLHRARKALRDAMLEHCGVTDPRECVDCRCVEDACCAA